MQYIASLSYGKDSMAMLHVIKDVLDLPLDRIITADVWATDTIPADLPPMVEFKDYADGEIKKRWGIEVEHFCAMRNGEKYTFQSGFYQMKSKCSKYYGEINGFPMTGGLSWCNELKRSAFYEMKKAMGECIEYIGIAVDETLRVERKRKENKRMPLVQAEWTEQMCFDWCKENDLLAPTYKTYARGGCWFCVNQSISTLRQLREVYPTLWQMLLKWDEDSPEHAHFHPDGKTVHDIEKRFKWEDEGYRPMQKQFRWADVENPQMNIFQFVGEDTE